MNLLRGGRLSIFEKLKLWFHSRELTLMRYDPHRLNMNILYFFIVFLLTIFIYNISPILNRLNLLFIRIGSIVLLVLVYFSIEFLYLVIRDSRKCYHNLRKGYKFLIAWAVIIILIVLLINQSFVFNHSKNLAESITLDEFNLFSVPELVDDTNNVVLATSISSGSDMRKFITFLPLPIGFILLWMMIVSIFLLLVIRFIFFGELPTWIILVLVAIFVFMAFQYSVPYAFSEVNGIGSCDMRGNLVFDFNPDTFNRACIDYRSSICRPLCKNKKTVCQCEVRLYDFVFRRDGNYFS